MLKIKNKHNSLKFLLGVTLSTLLFGCSKPENNTESTLSSKSSTNVAMCGSDKDCKGDRICDKGECKSPESKSMTVLTSKNSNNDLRNNDCPTDFESFVAKYRSDLEFQKRHTAKIVKEKTLEPEATKIEDVKFKDIKFPIIQTESGLKEQNMKQELNQKDDFYTVKDYLDASGFILVYKFKKDANCWDLVQSETTNL